MKIQTVQPLLFSCATLAPSPQPPAPSPQPQPQPQPKTTFFRIRNWKLQTKNCEPYVLPGFRGTGLSGSKMETGNQELRHGWELETGDWGLGTGNQRLSSSSFPKFRSSPLRTPAVQTRLCFLNLLRSHCSSGLSGRLADPRAPLNGRPLQLGPLAILGMFW